MTAPRYMHGDTRPRALPVATGQVAVVGDVISLLANTAVRGEDVAWDTNTATTQTAQSAGFVGVSMQVKLAVAHVFGNSEDNILMVATGGVWEFDCTSATYEVGDKVGLAKQSGNLLESQKVVAVATELLMIGRVAKRGTTITRVLVELLGTLTPAARQS